MLPDPDPLLPSEFEVPTSIACRSRIKNRPKLTLKDKVNILHRVIIEKHFEKDVAKEFRIS